MHYKKGRLKYQRWPLSFASSLLFITLFSNAATAVEPVNTLGSIGGTDLQIATGNAVQAICGSFIANRGEDLNANQATLFDKCGEMVQTANALTPNNSGPTDKILESLKKNYAARYKMWPPKRPPQWVRWQRNRKEGRPQILATELRHSYVAREALKSVVWGLPLTAN